MTTFNIVGAAPDGKLRVRSTDAAIDGTVARPTLSGPYFDNDASVETSEGTATKNGSSWQLGQTVETDSSSESGTVLYNATWLGLPRWAPRHDPTKPKKVQLGSVEATYNEDGTATVEGTDGSFTAGERTWNMADIAGDKSAFIRAKADHDWTQRTPFPPQAQHTPNPQYVGAANVLLNRDAALTPYFGRPEARRLPDGKYEEKSSRFSWLKATWTEGELALRDRDGAVTDEQQGQWGSATVGWTENVADVSAREGSVDSAAVGAKQRLRIRVPDVYTQLTLGEAYRDQDAQGFAYPGFGVETDGHVFITAKKDPASSTATFHAKGDVTISTDNERLFLGAKKQAMLASGGNNAYVLGGTGVVIAGGTEMPWADIVQSDGTTPMPPGWKDNLSGTASDINTIYSAVDAFVAASTGVYNGIKLGLGWSGSFWDKFALAGILFGNLGGAAVSGAGAVGAPSIGGTVVHGSGGLIMGSPHTTAVYSGTGLTLASILGTTVLSGAIGILGIGEVSIESKQKVEITTMNSAAMSAYNKVHIDSGRHAVYGAPFIKVGEHPEYRKWQTMRVDVGAKQGIELITDTGAPDVLRVLSSARDGGIIRMGAPKHIAIGADEKVSVGVKGSGEIALRVTDSPTDFLKLKKDLVDVESTSLVRLKAGSTSVEVKTDSISFVVGSMEAKLDSSSFVTPSGTFKSDGVKLNGQIRLGG